MEESDNNILSPTPPKASLQLSLVQETTLSDNVYDMDLDGDKTMVNDCIPSSSSLVPSINRELTPLQTEDPTQKKKADTAWIIQCMPKQPAILELVQVTRLTKLPKPPMQPPQLSDDMVHAKPSIGGFPIIHIFTSSWYNLLPKQREHFDFYSEPKLWV